MILVTVGNHVEPFDRLVKGMDALAGQIDEEVVIQTGHCSYEPQHARHFQFTSGKEMQALTKAARVQVSHAGSGSILTALRMGKPLVVVPRRLKYREHIDDHQLQLASAVEKQGKLVAVHEVTPEALLAAIEKAPRLEQAGPAEAPEMERLIGALRGYLEEWAPEKDKRHSRQEA
jgi:UDP-N-acetylglucosamine transferase subunit ALG13